VKTWPFYKLFYESWIQRVSEECDTHPTLEETPKTSSGLNVLSSSVYLFIWKCIYLFDLFLVYVWALIFLFFGVCVSLEAWISLKSFKCVYVYMSVYMFVQFLRCMFELWFLCFLVYVFLWKLWFVLICLSFDFFGVYVSIFIYLNFDFFGGSIFFGSMCFFWNHNHKS
jgi:hypothetical protein